MSNTELASFSHDVYLFRHGISKLPRPITVKHCHTIYMSLNLIMQVQKFGAPPLKNVESQKHAKFGPILHNIRL